MDASADMAMREWIASRVCRMRGHPLGENPCSTTLTRHGVKPGARFSSGMAGVAMQEARIPQPRRIGVIGEQKLSLFQRIDQCVRDDRTQRRAAQAAADAPL